MNFQHAGARTTLNTQHNSQLSTQFSTQRTTLNAQVLAQLSTRTILNTLNMQVPAQPLVLVGSLQQLGPDLVLNLRRITSLVHSKLGTHKTVKTRFWPSAPYTQISGHARQ